MTVHLDTRLAAMCFPKQAQLVYCLMALAVEGPTACQRSTCSCSQAQRFFA